MFKPFLKILLSLFALLVAFVIFLPMLISISKVNQFILSCVNKHIPGKLYAQEVKVGWTDGLYVRDLVVNDHEGKNVASFKKISCDVSLLSLLHMPEIVGKVEVVSPKISVLEVERALGTSEKRAQDPELILSDLHFRLDIEPEGKAEIDLTCAIENKGSQNGQIALKAKAKDIQELEKAYKTAFSPTTSGTAADVVMDCTIDHLPIKALVPFVNLANPQIALLLVPALGESLNGIIQHSYQGEELELSVALASQTFSTALHMQLEGTKLQILEPGSLKWKIRPEFFEQAKKLLPEHLVQNLSQQQTVTLLAHIAPQSGRLDDAGKMPLGITWGFDSPIIFKNPAWNSTLALKMQGAIATAALQEQVSLTVDLELSAGKEKTDLHLKADVLQPLKTPKAILACTLDGPLASFSKKFIQASTFPIEALLGKTTVLQTTFTIDEKEQSGTLSLQSETIKSELAINLENETLKVLPSTVQLQIKPELIAAFTPVATSTIPVALAIDSIEIPLDPKEIMRQAEVAAKIVFDPFSVMPTKEIGTVGINSASVTFAKDKNQPLVVQTAAICDFSKLTDRYKELVGSELSFEATCPLTITQELLAVSDVTATITSPIIQANLAKINATIWPKVWIESRAPITLSHRFSKGALPQTKLQLDQDLTVKATIEPFASIDDPIMGQIKIDSIPLKMDNESLGTYAFTLPFQCNLLTKQLQGNLLLSSDAAKLETAFTCALQEPSAYSVLPPVKVQLEGSMKEFPVKILSTLSNKPQLEALLGPKLQGSWKLGLDNALRDQPFHLSLMGTGLALETKLKLGKELVADNKAESITLAWHVTPERLSALQEMLQLAQSQKQKELALQSAFALQASVNSLNLPVAALMQEGKPVVLGQFLDALALDGSVALSEITLAPKEGATLAIAPLKGTAQVFGKERKITFAANSEKSDNPKAALLFVNGAAHNLWNENGIDVEKAKIVLDMRIQNLPLDIVHSIATKPETADALVAVLGPKVDANLKGEIKELHEGSFQGQIESPRLKSQVALLLKKGTLFLEKPLTAEYTLTPEAGQVLLKDVNPLLVTAARTQEPIKLWIDSKDFAIPLKPFSKKEMLIRNIKIEPGVLTCKNGGMLSLLVSLLKVKPNTSNEVNLWFTPIYVEVKNGIVNCKRSDALFADAFPLATWGKIDLEKDKVDMTLGISGRAISHAFDIPTIDPEYLVQIPIHGPTKSPKIDTGVATAKITALKMQQHSNNTTALLGGLLEVATAVVERDAPAPLPTTYPFPWSGQLQETKKQSKRRH